MSHSANTVSSHRLHPVERADKCSKWETHVGMAGFLYIVGPGARAMQRVSRERNLISLSIANRAIQILSKTHREDFEAGPEEIIAALVACGWERE